MPSKSIQASLGIILCLIPLQLLAQANPLPGPPPPEKPAPWSQQLAGSWTSLITNNWRMRMVTPPKGDYVGIPVTSAAVKAANNWDPAKDAADGQQCRSYGAAAIMMRPEHLHISWGADQKELVIDVDAGTQQRVLHVSPDQHPTDHDLDDNSPPPNGAVPSWQGYSTAHWRSRGTLGFTQPLGGQYLDVVTTRMLPGYVRQNGVPYSSNAILREHFDIAKAAEDETYLIVTSSVTDPTYLEVPLLLTAIFKKEHGDAGWQPTPCSSTW